MVPYDSRHFRRIPTQLLCNPVLFWITVEYTEMFYDYSEYPMSIHGIQVYRRVT